MRAHILVCLLVGCGNDVGSEPDAPVGPNPVEPRVIAGGGIGDGPIDGVVNVYVIDDATRMPVANAAVRVGTVSGVTDASGLFVANEVSGPQTIAVKAAGYRSDVWVGANGANVTLDLVQANPSPATGTLMGSITNFASIPVPANHVRVAVASYSHNDALGEAANEIAQPNEQNMCFGATACNFTLTSRTGKVAVVAAIFDHDPAAMTNTLIGWAVKTGLNVTANGTQTVALDIVPANMQQDVTVSFGTPPSGLTTVGSFVGIDTPDGTLQLLPMFQTPAAPTLRAPKPEAIASGATYRLTGIANDGATNPTQSIVLRRAQTGTTLSAGTWLAPPSGTPTRSGGSWSATSGATAYVLEYSQGATGIVNVTVFDGSTQVTIPDMIAMPSGSLTVSLQAIGAPGLDVNNFSLDADRDKLVMVGGQTVQLN